MFLDGPVLRIQGSIKTLNLFPHLSCKYSRTDKYFKGGGTGLLRREVEST